MALEINDGVRYALTPSALSIAAAAPWLVREAGQSSPRAPRLADRVREANRLRHGSRSTEKSYIGWIRRFILFHGKRHPGRDGRARGRAVPQLARRRGAGGSVNSKLGAECAAVSLPLRSASRAPLALTRDEVRAVISKLDGTHVLNRGPAAVTSPADRVLDL
jgi:hypothetical protein